MNAPLVLCLNSGSSSLKFSAVRFPEGGEEKVFEGAVEQLGSGQARFWVRLGQGDWRERKGAFEDTGAATGALLEWLAQAPLPRLDAVGHRLVHGGPLHFEPERVSEKLLGDLRDVVSFAPLHLPAELLAIELLAERLPGVPQVVCFDTAFHQRMPALAQRFALPQALFDAGLRRYGFHGLSYEYLVAELGPHALGNAVLAHLGNGASMAAVRGGECLDTTMGFGPTGGFMMGTRSGDLDPSVLIHLQRTRGYDAAGLEQLVNHEAGLLGVSGISADMQVLLGRAPADPNAALAVELFCYQAAKAVGALTTVLGGLQTLVFTGGIGEHAPFVRRSICARLGHLGIALEGERNERGEERVSSEESRVSVRVVRTDEDLMIARHVERLLFR